MYSPFKRLIHYIIILITMSAFLNLTSQKKRFYTYIGRRTMFVYLLHGIVIGILRGFAIYPFKDTVSIFTYLFLIVTSLIIVFVISSRFVCKWTNQSSTCANQRISKTNNFIITHRCILYRNVVLKICYDSNNLKRIMRLF